MNLKTVKTCTLCGSTRISRQGVDLGYTPARDLGRPAGAKGQDEFAILERCLDCDGILWDWAPAPCHICGGSPVEYVDMLSLNGELTGLMEWVPTLPNDINLCSNPDCREKLHKRVMDAMDEAFFE